MEIERCPACHGRGTVYAGMMSRETCETCDGAGVKPTRPDRAAPAQPAPDAGMEVVAEARVTNRGFGREVITTVAHGLSDGRHDLVTRTSAEARIQALSAERDEAIGSAERQWTGWVKEEVARKAAEQRLAEAMKVIEKFGPLADRVPGLAFDRFEPELAADLALAAHEAHTFLNGGAKP